MKFFKSLLQVGLLAFSQRMSEADALPMPRSVAPSFSAVNSVLNNEFGTVSLDDFKGKYLVLVFYPFDFTYVCPTELIAFSENLQKFKELGAEVLGISTDSHFTHLAWLK